MFMKPQNHLRQDILQDDKQTNKKHLGEWARVCKFGGGVEDFV